MSDEDDDDDRLDMWDAHPDAAAELERLLDWVEQDIRQELGIDDDNEEKEQT